MAEELGRSLEQLTATIQEQNKELKRKDSLDELDKSITSLEKSGTENSVQLRQTLANIQIALDSASNAEQMELAEEQLEALKDLAGTEEENREAARRQEEANEFLSKIVSGIDGLADSYDKMLDNLKPSGGLLAGLGAAALLFMDPETLFAGVQSAIDGVFAIVDSIKMFLEGDFTAGFELLGDNIGAVSAIVGTIVVLFGGRIIRLFSGLVKGVRGVVRGVSALASRFSGLTKIFGRIFLPFTIITGAIGAIQGAIDGFKEDGVLGGIEGAISGLLTTIVGYPLDLLTSAVAWIAGKLGFENAQATLEAFSFSELIDNTIGGIFDIVKGAFNWIGTLFTDPVAALDKLAMALIGPDGILGIITAPIDKAINWVMGLFGIKDPTSDFSLYDTLYTPIDKAITWMQGLFTDPAAALQQAWNGLVGEGGLVDILLSPVDKAITWIQGLFNWGDPDLPFDIREFIKLKAQAAIDWVKGLFVWASEGISEGWTNLTDFISGKWIQVKAWFTNLLLFTSTAITDTWDGLTEFVSTKWTAVKTWFTGLFTWASDGLSEGWTNLTDFVKGKWTSTKEWFTGMFTWSSDESEKGVIQELFDSTIEKIKTFFTDLFDFLPTLNEIKGQLTSMLPEWMQPASIEEQRAELIDQLAEMEAKAAAALPAAEQFDNPLTNDTREDFEAEAAAIRVQLAELEQLRDGGIVKAPETGGLAMLHGAEIVAPLDSPQGKVLMAINDLMNAKASVGAGEYGGMGGPMVVQGGSSSTSNNTNNVSTSTYTIQQGITPDDFLKRDFLNFSY